MRPSRCLDHQECTRACPTARCVAAPVVDLRLAKIATAGARGRAVSAAGQQRPSARPRDAVCSARCKNLHRETVAEYSAECRLRRIVRARASQIARCGCCSRTREEPRRRRACAQQRRQGEQAHACQLRSSHHVGDWPCDHLSDPEADKAGGQTELKCRVEGRQPARARWVGRRWWLVGRGQSPLRAGSSSRHRARWYATVSRRPTN